MAIGVTQGHPPGGVSGGVGARPSEPIRDRIEVHAHEAGLHMPQVLGAGVRWNGPTIGWDPVVKKLYARPGRATQGSNAHPGAGHAAEPLLLDPPVLASAQHAQSETITIEPQRRLSRRYGD